LYSLRDGRVISIVLYMDHERALADLGLPPGQPTQQRTGRSGGLAD